MIEFRVHGEPDFLRRHPRIGGTETRGATTVPDSRIGHPTHELTLVFDGPYEACRDILDRLCGAIDDATHGRSDGFYTCDFHRDAATREDAIASAIRDVKAAGVGLTFVRVEDE
jgi:hypothetical protein